MAKRKTTTNDEGGAYFASPSASLEFIQSGCALLDSVLGGGYPLGRVVNIVGDKSTGKTLLAIEAAANFTRRYRGGKVFYRETEAAFDESYAAALGMPVDKIDFGSKETLFTVEEMGKDIIKQVTKLKESGTPGLYILDSLDALSDEAEQKRELGESSYGTGKAKGMSELFRRVIKPVEQSRVCVIIISQIRDKINAMFGEKYTRAGGHALDFYASQILWLSHLGTKVRTVDKVKRPVGISVKAKCKKNKVGLPFRECSMRIDFGFGVREDITCIDWLVEVGRLSKKEGDNLLDEITDSDDEKFPGYIADLRALVKDEWSRIETSFLPTRKKYT